MCVFSTADGLWKKTGTVLVYVSPGLAGPVASP